MSMKILERTGDSSSHRGRMSAGSILFTAVLLVGLVMPVLAGDGDSSGRGNGGPGGDTGGPGVAGGDETVGTLPIVGRSTIQLPLTRTWRGDHPAFYLEGTTVELAAVITGARGRGFASIETLDASSGRVRIAFHCDVTVVLDRELLGVLGIQSGLAVPAAFGAEQVTMQWQTGGSRSTRLRTGLLPLAIASMSADGRLEQSPLDIRSTGSDGRHGTDRFRATPSTVILRQSY
jgi:hypothetical protein